MLVVDVLLADCETLDTETQLTHEKIELDLDVQSHLSLKTFNTWGFVIQVPLVCIGGTAGSGIRQFLPSNNLGAMGCITPQKRKSKKGKE